MPDTQRTFLKVLGPGLLFAGAAVGVSHLVQSTRAGAVFGLQLIVVVILANVLKYPAFQFGPRYAAATGTSLLEGYRRLGRWALVIYGLVTVGTMFTVQAAVALVTAALLNASLGLQISPVVTSAVLIGICAVLNGVGHFKLLDAVMKLVVAVLTIATFVATALIASRVDWSGPWLPDVGAWDLATMGVIAGLVGWMPSAIDISVWHSLWTLAKRKATGHRPSVRQSLLDFDIGYVGTALLAICFVLLGAGLMHGADVTPAAKPVAFANQVIGLYTQALGDWAGPIIRVCAIAVMFSTTLTVVDGFPRALAALAARWRSAQDGAVDEDVPQRPYWIALAVLAVGSVLLLAMLLDTLTAFVDLATTLSFLTAPILASLNHMAMFSPDVAERPGPAMRWFSLIAIVFMAAVAAGWIWLMFLA